MYFPMLLHPHRFGKAGIGRDYARRAYSYVEFVIVIIIMIILGLIAMPLVHTDTGPRKIPRKYLIMREDMARVQSAIDQYYLDHGYIYPGFHDLIDGEWKVHKFTDKNENFMKQLYGWTNSHGVVAGPGDSREDFPLGPYLQGEFPTNPILGNNDISITGQSAWSGLPEGWIFGVESGRFKFNGMKEIYLEDHYLGYIMETWEKSVN